MKHTRKLLVLAAGVVGGVGIATTGWTYWSTQGSGTATATVGTWKTDTTTAVNSSVNPSVVAQPVTFTATVTAAGAGSPSGNMVFFDGAAPISSCGGATGTPLNGSAAECVQTYATVATHTVTAKYLGDTNFNASPLSASVTQAVHQGSTATSMTVSGSPTVYGSETSVVFSVAVTAPVVPTGTVTVKQGTTALCSISLPATTCSPEATALNASPTAYSITASYSGDPNLSGSTSAAQNLTVNKATPVISWTPPAAITYGTALSATQLNAAANVAGRLAYNPAAGTILPAGDHQLGVTFTPDDTTNYTTAAAGVSTLTVNKATLTVNANDTSKTYGAANPTFNATITGYLNGDPGGVVTGAPAFTTSATTSSPVGTYAVVPSQGTLSATNYNFTFTNGILTVAQASTSTSLTVAQTSVAYGNETAQTFTITVTPQFTGTPTGKVTVKNGTTTLCTINLPVTNCSLTRTQLTPGAYSSVAATYNGDTNFMVATSTPTKTFSVVNGQLRISALTQSAANQNSNFWRATATITVQDAFANPVSGVLITSTWAPSDPSTSCTTASNGLCEIQTGNLSRSSVASATWTVASLAATNYTYSASANVQSSITINKP